MAEYSVSCPACGKLFTAKRRHATFCSDACQKRAKRGSIADGPATLQDGETRIFFAAMSVPQSASGRQYLLYRGTLKRADSLTADKYGRIISGYLTGRTLREILQTAVHEGWLAYRHRPDGWYSAEWADGRIALCGPLKSLPGAG